VFAIGARLLRESIPAGKLASPPECSERPPESPLHSLVDLFRERMSYAINIPDVEYFDRNIPCQTACPIHTECGRYVQAIGSNEQVARYAAVGVDSVKILTYVLLGVCVGIATLLYVPRLGSASPTTGLLWELEAIAAVIVGGTALKGGSGSVVGTVIGAILLSVISNILNLTSIISVYLNAAVQGFVIIVVAFLQRGRR